LVFLLDEMSQYIGSNTSLLLNLQSIIEEIGTYCENKIWITCTAQQDLSNLIENRDNKTEDFGKILGRFDTKISLQSQDAAYITKKRVLDKNEEAEDALTEFFKSNKVAIENQFVVVHDLYKSYSSREDFLLTYPFIPYQFQLIKDVFSAFSRANYVTEGVRDSERSILGTTHFTAQECMHETVGYFVPFDLFFNEQLRSNLTHRANNIVTKAYMIEEVKNNVFAQRVVNVLFMLSSLSESQQVNFPATVENIAHLLMSNLTDTKLDLQRETEQYLKVLVDKKIIQESDNIYRFYKEDEIEVANLIDSTGINGADQLNAIEAILIKAVGTLKLKYNFGNNNFNAAADIDTKIISAKGDFKVHYLFFDPRKPEDIALEVSRQDLIVCCNEWFVHDKSLRKLLNKYIKTNKFIGQNLSAAQGRRKETIQNFGIEAEKDRENLALQFKTNFAKTRFISAQAIVNAEDLTKQSAKDRLDEVIDKHLKEIFNKHDFAKNYVKIQGELRIKAADGQQTTDKSLTPAEEAVENYLNMQSEGIAVSDVVKHFEKVPYGWKDISTLHVLIELNKKDKRRFEWRNQLLSLKDFAVEAVNSRNRDAITIFAQKGYSPLEVANFIHEVNNVAFSETLIPSNTQDFKIAVETLKEKLKDVLKTTNDLKESNEGLPYNQHFKAYYTAIALLYEERNEDKLFNSIFEKSATFAELRDKYVSTKEFVEDRTPSMLSFKEFTKTHYANFNTLDEVDKIKAQRLQEFLKSDSEPWNHFPEMKKIHKDLKNALQTKVNELQLEVGQKYQAAFEELVAKQTEFELVNILPDMTTYLEALQSRQTIAELQLEIRKVKDFKANQLKRLYDARPKLEPEPETTTIPEKGSTGETPSPAPKPYPKPKRATFYTVNEDDDLPNQIESEAQLNDYINTLRAKLLAKLKNNEIIILK
jgi:hypothetical protein